MNALSNRMNKKIKKMKRNMSAVFGKLEAERIHQEKKVNDIKVEMD